MLMNRAHERAAEMSIPPALALAVARADAGDRRSLVEVIEMLHDSERALDAAGRERSGAGRLVAVIRTVLVSALGVVFARDEDVSSAIGPAQWEKEQAAIFEAADVYGAFVSAASVAAGVTPVEQAGALSTALATLRAQLEQRVIKVQS